MHSQTQHHRDFDISQTRHIYVEMNSKYTPKVLF